MDDILNRPIVLVLNRNWQAINVRTPQQAFVQMATDVATALDIDGENMVPVRWAQWIKLPVRETDYAVRTPSGPRRINLDQTTAVKGLGKLKIRPIRLDDEQQKIRFHAGISEESIYMRYFEY